MNFAQCKQSRFNSSRKMGWEKGRFLQSGKWRNGEKKGIGMGTEPTCAEGFVLPLGFENITLNQLTCL